MHWRARAAAQHSLEAHVMLEVARHLRRAARSCYVIGLDAQGDSLRRQGLAMDARRRRHVKKIN